MNVAHVLTGMGALEYTLTYQPYAGAEPWSLSFDGIEVSGPTVRTCINRARAQRNLNAQDT